jgi:non-specific serine/threonine protein kinase
VGGTGAGGPALGDIGGEIILGATLRFAAVAARFCAGLVRRGEVVPGLAPDDDSVDGRAWHAFWRPLYLADASAGRHRLATALPPAARAQLLGAELTGRPAAEVLEQMLTSLTDAAVRLAFAEHQYPLTVPVSLLPPRTGRGTRHPVATAWLTALTAPRGGRFRIDEETDARELAQLAERLGEWLESGGIESGPVRTCFRLIAPGEDDANDEGDRDLDDRGDPAGEPEGEWLVELLLQSARDPSLIVGAADIWRGGPGLRAISRYAADPGAELLAGLDRAAGCFPDLRRALRHGMPVTLPLTTEAAHEFLRTIAPALAHGGFGVLLPAWCSGGSQALRFGVKLKAAAGSVPQPGAVDSPARVGLAQLVDYEWRVAIGDQELTAEELAELSRLKAPLVKLRGRWVEVDARKLDAAAAFVERARRRPMTVADVVRTELFGLGPEAEGVALAEVESSGWLGDVLSGAPERRPAPLPTPPDLQGTLRPYQGAGLGWLSFMDALGLGTCLADDMGLGKTIQVLALLVDERQAGRDSGATLLICPVSLIANWQREAARFTPKLRVHVHHGSERLSADEFAAAVSGSDLVITTYAMALRDAATLGQIEWHRVVVDEAQAIKNSAAKQSKAIRELRARHRIALTGTPVENRLADLYSIMEFANPGLFGTPETFARRFARPIERDGDAEAAGTLRRATGAFVLRRLKTDPAIISDLPEKLEMTVACTLTVEQASLYRAVVDDMLTRVAAADGMSRRGLVLATMLKLKQVCNHPAQLLKDGSRIAGRSGKLARLEEICDEIVAGGEKALLFTQFAEFGAMLRDHLSKRFRRDMAFLHGGVAKTNRDAMVAEFQDGSGPPLFVLSLKAGGVGLNLTAASHVIHVDRWWNPAVEDQATDRAFRIGQSKDVQVRKFVCAGTLEERIDGMIQEKKGLAERIVGAGESWLTELSTAQLREVIALAADAVVA